MMYRGIMKLDDWFPQFVFCSLMLKKKNQVIEWSNLSQNIGGKKCGIIYKKHRKNLKKHEHIGNSKLTDKKDVNNEPIWWVR